MKLYHWQIGFHDMLVSADSEAEARVVLTQHVTEALRGDWQAEERKALLTALEEAPTFVAEPGYPIMVGHPLTTEPLTPE